MLGDETWLTFGSLPMGRVDRREYPVADSDLVERRAAAISTITELQTSSDPGLKLALTAARVAEENRGRDVVVLDMRSQTCEFDYFVIATGSSRRQLHAMAEEIDHVCEDELGEHRRGREGFQNSDWILMDYGNVVIHLFDEERRFYYDLEHLWGGAKRVPLPEVRPEPETWRS